jgi:hypothetical protein
LQQSSIIFLAESVEPGQRNADETIARLIAVLDSQDVALAMERLEKGHRLRVVK